ncbi:hypothetical protein LEMA_P057550.1 [Plenodomus lingam JN3]|uniref:Origin recognition complex subunit 4 n=1 Tax=Leptosphaeria maculans (strain JN3 / isolate v23.1.3 / race Av1-4-5-6-7-8) TaxID=985895 RepID=E4ZHF1_LEPMJ|nr:hypothetical protein LEMA_P057550.1 [Plenodomus lingam JN3]CBX90721.1 hypothetical protein LEMA_P057550.1 [Plenodomus lingam JN3]
MHSSSCTMDDSPRSSKRRKIDTPKHIASLQEKTKTATKGTPNKPQGRLAKSTTKSTRAKEAAAEEIDIYDDIEGALGVKPSAPKRAQPQTTSRAKASSSGGHPDELQDTPVTVKRGRGRPPKAQSASRTAFRNTVTRYKAGSEAEAEVEVEVDTQDKLAEQAPSPTNRSKTARTPAKSARKPAAPRNRVRGKKQPTPGQDEETPATPSRSIRRRPLPKAKTTAITESADELADPVLASSRKRTASTRRRSNRTDHIDNGQQGHLSDIEMEVNEYADANNNDEEGVDGNSLVGSVLDPTEPSPFNKPSSAQKDTQAPPLIFGEFAAGKGLDLLKTIVMDRITGRRPSPLVGLDDEYKSVYQVVEHTITAGEGNSMLVIGARGSGKTALVNTVLSEVAKDNSGEYHVVRLNGFIHTDDKIALREIWRQLGKEMEVEEDGSGPGKNYADTLATLLALLSHPSEHTGEVTDQVAKAVIFVMDEFDLFAQHPRQTLLYNLFDIAQSRKAPIAVLGLTTRIDVTNSLEKRVKSRFSHRFVHLSLAKTFTAFQEICKACLLIQPEHLTIEERGILDQGMKSTPQKKVGTKTTSTTPSILSEWNTTVSQLFLSSTFLTTHLAPTFYTSKSTPKTLSSFLLPLSSLSSSTPFYPTPPLTPPDSKLSLIPHLSTLALSLLIATARLDIIHDTDTANFNMAYDEYVTLASRARIQSAAGGVSASSAQSKVWGKEVARREWEGLLGLGLVMPVGVGAGGAFGMVRCDVSLEEVGEVLKRGKERGLERWCRSL